MKGLCVNIPGLCYSTYIQKPWYERKRLHVYTNMPVYGWIFGMITTKDVAIVFSCLWYLLCFGLTIIHVMLWQIKLGRLCWYWENRYYVKRFGDNIRLIERNLEEYRERSYEKRYHFTKFKVMFMLEMMWLEDYLVVFDIKLSSLLQKVNVLFFHL